MLSVERWLLLSVERWLLKVVGWLLLRIENEVLGEWLDRWLLQLCRQREVVKIDVYARVLPRLSHLANGIKPLSGN